MVPPPTTRTPASSPTATTASTLTNCNTASTLTNCTTASTLTNCTTASTLTNCTTASKLTNCTTTTKTKDKKVVSHDEEQASSTLHYVKNVAPVKDPDNNSGTVPHVQQDNPSSVPTVQSSSSSTARSKATSKYKLILTSLKILLGLLINAWMMAGPSLVDPWDTSSALKPVASTRRTSAQWTGSWRGTRIPWSQGTDTSRGSWKPTTSTTPQTSGYGSHSNLYKSRGGRGKKVPPDGETNCIQYQDDNSDSLQQLREEIIRKTQVKLLENKVSAEDPEYDPDNAPKLSTRINEDEVEYRGSAKDCQTNSWIIDEEDKDSGELGIQHEYDVATPNQKVNECIKLEDDQGGGEVNATKVTEKVEVTAKMWATLPHHVKNQMTGVDTFPTNIRVQSKSVATIPTNYQVLFLCLNFFQLLPNSVDTFPTNYETQV